MQLSSASLEADKTTLEHDCRLRLFSHIKENAFVQNWTQKWVSECVFEKKKSSLNKEKGENQQSKKLKKKKSPSNNDLILVKEAENSNNQKDKEKVPFWLPKIEWLQLMTNQSSLIYLFTTLTKSMTSTKKIKYFIRHGIWVHFK